MPGPADFLFEIGVEELPPKSLQGLEKALRHEFQQGLQEARLEHEGTGVLCFASSPGGHGPQACVAATGASYREAGAAAGGRARWERTVDPRRQGFVPTPSGCAPERLQTLRTEKGAWLMFRGRRAGRAAAALLPEIASSALKRLPIARAMRWGPGPEEFIRPAHWIVMLHGKRVVPAASDPRPAQRDAGAPATGSWDRAV